MKYLLLLVLMATSAIGQSTYQVYEDTESGTSGAMITTTMLTDGLHTNGLYLTATINPSPHTQFYITNDSDAVLRAPFLVGSTLFDGAGHNKTFCVRIDNNVDRYCRFTLPTSAMTGQFAVGWYWKFSPTTDIGDFVDTVYIHGASGGEYSVAAYRDDSGVNKVVRVHTNTGADIGFGVGVGAPITVTSNTTYWLTLLVNTNNGATGTSKLAVFDPTTWRIIGISTLQNGTKGMVDYWEFGDLQNHSASGTGWRMFFDDFIIETGVDAVNHWPLLPVGGTVTAASVSRTDFNTAYTNAQSSVGTNHDVVALPTGSATWTSGYTVAKNGLVIKGNGTNNTTITGDNGTNQFDLFTVTGNFNTLSNFTITGDGSNDELTGIRNSASYNRYSRLQIKECSVGVFAENPGLIDNSLILNCEHSSRNIFGSSFYDTWNPLPLDSTNAFYYEDCRIQWTSSKNTIGPSPFMTSQEGQAWVVRHCYFEITQAGTGAEPAFDHHGDWDPGSQAFYRPGTMLQIYSNVFNFTQDAPSAHGCKFVDVRGGPFTMIYSNNVLAGNYASSDGIVYREEHMFDDATPYTLTNAFNFRNTQPNGNMPVNNPLENGGQVFAGREYTNVAPAVLVQLSYPHPLRNEPAPPPGIINSCCGASIGAGRVRGVIVSRP